MEYADSGTLQYYLKKNFDDLIWKDKYNLAYQLSCAVLCMHDEGIIHRDLHSNNVLVHNKTIKLADFGLSKRIEEESSNQSSSKSNYGVLFYIDPNKLKNKQYKLNLKSDVYSIGVLLWEITSGRPPFDDPHNIDLLTEIHEGRREKIIPDTPEAYVQIYTECWNDKPDNRPNMSQVVSRLKAIANISNGIENNQMSIKSSHQLSKEQQVNSNSYSNIYNSSHYNYMNMCMSTNDFFNSKSVVNLNSVSSIYNSSHAELSQIIHNKNMDESTYVPITKFYLLISEIGTAFNEIFDIEVVAEHNKRTFNVIITIKKFAREISQMKTLIKYIQAGSIEKSLNELCSDLNECIISLKSIKDIIHVEDVIKQFKTDQVDLNK
ncbi:12917_t:CDS:2, partial [Funneliformis geosporum]